MNETLIVYLYGIWGNMETLLNIAVSITLTITLISLFVVSVVSVEGYHTEEDKKKLETVKKFILIKTNVFLLVLNTFIPPKEIFVAMLAATPVVNTVKELGNSEKMSKIEKILDLSLDKAVRELEKSNE